MLRPRLQRRRRLLRRRHRSRRRHRCRRLWRYRRRSGRHNGCQRGRSGRRRSRAGGGWRGRGGGRLPGPTRHYTRRTLSTRLRVNCPPLWGLSQLTLFNTFFWQYRFAIHFTSIGSYAQMLQKEFTSETPDQMTRTNFEKFVSQGDRTRDLFIQRPYALLQTVGPPRSSNFVTN